MQRTSILREDDEIRDDIIVFSDTFEEHLVRLEKVFNRLQEHNLCLKRTKCEFLQKEVEFLGHTVSTAGLQPNIKKVEVIKQHPVPIELGPGVKSFRALRLLFRGHGY